VLLFHLADSSSAVRHYPNMDWRPHPFQVLHCFLMLPESELNIWDRVDRSTSSRKYLQDNHDMTVTILNTGMIRP
jgi:hypothetical protein